ncbi:hypothetical protein RUM43_011904 [Polyplax serrata]|uniref:RFX-type winged-helix domain-containing protein n=1 Tax=Polyplax serrata TaxID=468196 RepID=A0AAN8PJX9_POLSC
MESKCVLSVKGEKSSKVVPSVWPLNPLGNRQEIQQTIVWIKTHLEEDSEISIPKQDVYDQYLKYCENVSMKPLSTADFGKVMKQVYPGVRPRRLGTRGNSRYCYSGMRNTSKLPTPILPRSTTENCMGNGCSVTSFLSADSNKPKKVDKSKRKWSSSICRSDKVTGTNRSPSSVPDKASTCPVKSAKRSKSLREIDCTNFKGAEETAGDVLNDVKSYDVALSDVKAGGVNLGDIKSEDLGDLKYEDCSDNSFSAFDIDCELRNDFGVYLKKLGGEDPTTVDSLPDRQNGNHKVAFTASHLENSALAGEQQIKEGEEPGTITNENVMSKKGDQISKPNISTNHIADTIKGLNNGNKCGDKQRVSKTKPRRAGTPLKATKNCKKSLYVPIQPKPTEGPSLGVRYDKSHIQLERKNESEGVALCEESDSQEPEEEIVRYFKHLDESEMKANDLVDEAVKNIENSTVQIRDTSRMRYGGREDANHQLLRSQSCFEEQRLGFGQEEKKNPLYLTRSQSTVELPTSTDQVHQDVTDTESDAGGRKNKISHLRILLEMSISSSGKTPYATMKGDSPNAVMASAQNSVTDSLSHVDSNYMLSNMKPMDRDVLKSNGTKVLNKCPPLVPHSPNTRTKYMNFTPISPGPQSPLKVSPGSSFVSPRETPVPRSRQNSHTDHFLPPSDRKSTPVRFDASKVESLTHNFSKTGKVTSRTPPTFASGSRPRSYSSVNFYRSKARKTSTKPSGFDRSINSLLKNQIQSLADTGQSNSFTMNPPFSVQQVGQNFTPGESLSSEVQKFLNNSKASDVHVGAMIRSQSVPLNRMVSESSWVTSGQISGMYPGYFGSGNPGKLSDDVVSGPGATSKDGESMSTFVTNGDMANLTGEIFSGDSGIVDLNEQYFSGDFQRQNGDNFPESQGFSEESTFSNKLTLNAGGTFDSAFANDSDPAIGDNIKSYLPDFEGLDNKGLVESTGAGEEVAETDRKLFKSTLYEVGNDNLKDPVITSFKPVLMNDMSGSPGSPVLNFFGTKINEDSQQLIEFFDFVD